MDKCCTIAEQLLVSTAFLRNSIDSISVSIRLSPYLTNTFSPDDNKMGHTVNLLHCKSSFKYQIITNSDISACFLLDPYLPVRLVKFGTFAPNECIM